MLNPWAAKAAVGAPVPSPNTGEAAQLAQDPSGNQPAAEPALPTRRCKKNSTGHAGVSRLANGKWQARMTGGNQRGLGCFDSVEEAAAMVAAARLPSFKGVATRVHKPRGTVRVLAPGTQGSPPTTVT